MTSNDLLAKKLLRRHKPSAREVEELLRVVARDLADAAITKVSTDRRFATAYNAALQLATIALHAAGYRAAGKGHHWATIQALPAVMGPQARTRADFLDSCRTKRNVTDYGRAGEVSEVEVNEILAEARAFRDDLLAWLRSRHPALLPVGKKRAGV